MDLTQLAKELIHNVSGDSDAKNIEGVVEVFKGIIQGINNNWEQHLADETNEALMHDDVKCLKCNTKTRIERTRHTIYASSLDNIN